MITEPTPTASSCSASLSPHGLILAGALAATLVAGAEAPASYTPFKELTTQLRTIERVNKNLVRLSSLAESLQKREVWLLEIGLGNDAERAHRPALLLTAGIEGNDLAGTASALRWADQLARGYETNTPLHQLLDTTTIYILPRLNPDAAERFFAKPQMEFAGTVRPIDDDRDGQIDEDGPEDLDKDGRITSMRVEDPAGEFVLDPVDSRLLMKADKLKGETGRWRLLSEGIDNDGDEAWNEDGPGGVNLNRNFPYGFKFFAADAGAHAMSEVESRALADFVVAHPNIGICFTFGATENLTQTPKTEAPKRPPTSIQDDDGSWYREMGKLWRDTLGLKAEISAGAEAGTFADWIYFHRGRLALTTRPWSPALALELFKTKPKEEKEAAKESKPDDAAKKADAEKPKKGADEKPAAPEKRNEEDRAYLKWLDENAPGEFVAWKTFAHPDFPGKKVEIGGWAPFARTTPPAKFLESLTERHARYLTALAGKLPRVAIRQAEAKPIGESIYDVRVQVENTGYLPTSLAQGATTREVAKTRVTLKVDDKAMISGHRMVTFGPIEGSGGMKEARYIIRAKDKASVEVEVVSALGGTVRTTLKLGEKP